MSTHVLQKMSGRNHFVKEGAEMPGMPNLGRNQNRRTAMQYSAHPHFGRDEERASDERPDKLPARRIVAEAVPATVGVSAKHGYVAADCSQTDCW